MKQNSLVQYLLSKDFRSQLKAAFAIFFGIIFFSSVSLYFCTRHNSSRPIPNFKGLTIEEAKELGDDYNFRVTIIDSVYNQDQKPGTVVDQEPKTGFRVKKNRRIFLIMNAFNPEKIEMPNVVGVSLRQAIAILESNGLTVGHLKYVPDIATNNVLNQRFKGKDIKPGSEIIKGSHIDMILGRSGSYEPTYVPDLKGLTLRMAEKSISVAYLNLGAVLFDKTVVSAADSLEAVVVKQKPEVGNGSVSMGILVDIWLSVKKENEETETEE